MLPCFSKHGAIGQDHRRRARPAACAPAAALAGRTGSAGRRPAAGARQRGRRRSLGLGGPGSGGLAPGWARRPGPARAPGPPARPSGPGSARAPGPGSPGWSGPAASGRGCWTEPPGAARCRGASGRPPGWPATSISRQPGECENSACVSYACRCTSVAHAHDSSERPKSAGIPPCVAGSRTPSGPVYRSQTLEARRRPGAATVPSASSAR